MKNSFPFWLLFISPFHICEENGKMTGGDRVQGKRSNSLLRKYRSLFWYLCCGCVCCRMPGFANIWGKITPSAGVQTVRHIVSAEKLTIISKIIDLIALGMDGERENVKRDVIAGQRLEEGTILNHYNSTGFQLLKRTLSYEVCQEDLRYWKKSYLTYKPLDCVK